MFPPRFYRFLPVLLAPAILAPAIPASLGQGAPEKGVPSDATAIPMPPPVPPARPPELGTGAATRIEAAPEPGAPAPGAPPRPPARPADLSAPAAGGGEAGKEIRGGEAGKDIRGGEAARETAKDGEAGAMPAPPPRPPELSEPALAISVAPVDDGPCRRRLERLGARFAPLPAIADGQCGASQPLKLTALADDLILAPPATLVCEAAEALARWATEAQAAAERDLGQPLKGLTIGTSYACRGQNHDPDAKLSEHSFANGLDVMGFTFEKRPAIGVVGLAEGSPEATFLASVRGRACGFFRTVLGPGSDPAHANHLHLDERARPAGHRLCQ